MKTPLLVAGSIGVLALIGTQACTLGSDTYITMEPEVSSGDGGAEGGKGGGGGGNTPAPSGGGGDCKRDFVKVDLAKLTACGGGKGHCYAKDKSPLADQFVPCENASEVCVPDEVLSAAGEKLKSCTSVIGPGGCITSSALPELEKRSAGALKPDVCAAGQLCVPCVDPTNNGAPTPFCQPIGVYDKACAAGGAGGGAGDGGAPAAAAPCCTTKGKSNGVCFPEASLPPAEKDDAPADTCADGLKCVPKALVDGKPVKCKAGVILGQGVCMDGCFNTMLGIAGKIGILDQDVCSETESCVPCSFLKDKGVPGCT